MSDIVYYAPCINPECSDAVRLPDDCLDPDREDGFSVPGCDACSSNFDFNDDDALTTSIAEWKRMNNPTSN